MNHPGIWITNYWALTGRVLGRYCGNSTPSSVDTSSNVASVKFVTDGSVTASGFRLQFKSSRQGEPNELLETVLFPYRGYTDAMPDTDKAMI